MDHNTRRRARNAERNTLDTINGLADVSFTHARAGRLREASRAALLASRLAQLGARINEARRAAETARWRAERALREAGETLADTAEAKPDCFVFTTE